MIEQETINEMATKWQTQAINVAREYIQNLFLSFFYEQKEAKSVLFKGGTAIRVVYQSPRFSEDLDFSTNKFFSLKELESLIINTIVKVEQVGIETDLEESKSTAGGYLCIISFKFLEYNLDIHVEVSFRKKNEAEGETIVVKNDFIPSYTIIALKQKQLVREKIQATLTRQKPRDFFDIYFLLRAGMIDAESKIYLKDIREKTVDSKIDFSNELKNFLPIHHYSIIKDFKETLIREIDRS